MIGSHVMNIYVRPSLAEGSPSHKAKGENALHLSQVKDGTLGPATEPT